MSESNPDLFTSLLRTMSSHDWFFNMVKSGQCLDEINKQIDFQIEVFNIAAKSSPEHLEALIRMQTIAICRLAYKENPMFRKIIMDMEAHILPMLKELNEQKT